ncbi:MAG: hypothetical protein ACKVOR_04915 [Flavobacteriales bacterium]
MQNPSIQSPLRILLLIIVFTSTLSSCFINRYRAVETKWSKAEGSTPTFTTPDSSLRVIYNLWREGGQMQCSIHNLTDSAINLIPFYTIDILSNRDSVPMMYAEQCIIMDSTGFKQLKNFDVELFLINGIDIPIPPHGSAQLNTIPVHANLRWDDRYPIPDDFDKAVFQEFNSPFVYTKQIAYAKGSEEKIQVVKHSCFVETVEPYRFMWHKNAVPENKKKNDTYYVTNVHAGPLTVIGMIGIVVLLVLAGGEDEGD